MFFNIIYCKIQNTRASILSLNLSHLHIFVTILKLSNFMLTGAFIKIPVCLILFHFMVYEMSEYWRVQFHTDTMNHFTSPACYILLIFGQRNVVSDSMQYFTFNVKRIIQTKYEGIESFMFVHEFSIFTDIRS